MKKAIYLAIITAAQAQAGIIADTLFMECRGEPEAGRKAVASVIYNRSLKSGKPMESVCLAPKQFSCWNKGYHKPTPRKGQERAILAEFEAIEKAMLNRTFKPSGVWTHYHAKSVCPTWSRGMRNRQEIGNHVFGVTK